MVVLMPCAGLYKRFPQDGLPKYLRPMKDMRPMFLWAIDSLKDINDPNIFFAIRRDDEKWNASQIIKQFLPKSEILILEKITDGPAHTVQLMLEHFNIQEPFIIKDCDCRFKPKWSLNNAVFVAWRETSIGDRGTKSWVELDGSTITKIEEKKTPKDWYSCGGYQFMNPQLFQDVYKELPTTEEKYCSHIIQSLIRNGETFQAIFCDKPEDCGTWEKYIEYRRRERIIFFDLDGVIVKAGSPYGKNLWRDTCVLPEVKQKMIELKQKGDIIFILTSRLNSCLEDTKRILEQNGIPYDQIIGEIPFGQRIIINDYAPSNPYPTAEAINTKRNSADWIHMI